MKTCKLLIVSFLTAIPTVAGPHVYSDKRLAVQRQAVSDALLSVAVNDSEWSVFVVPEKDWKAALRNGESGHTAFTLVPHKLTYVNADWVKNTDPSHIARILAHEYGHILCDCRDENIAEGYVSTLFRQR